MEIINAVRDAAKYQEDTESDAYEFDTEYYRKLPEKAWDEVVFVLQCDSHN